MWRAVRLGIATQAVRTVNWVSQRSGRGSGTVIGGTVGLFLAPELLTSLANDRRVILVTGTNGKTTTTALVAAGWDGDVTSNDTGANMPAGHVAALARSGATRVVLETDEAWLGATLEATSPAVIVLLNLSRDQLDRASEVRQIAERWRNFLAKPQAEDAVIVANALDPLVVYAANEASNVRWCATPTSWTADTMSCPRCTEPLLRTDDRWWCTCGLAQPSVSSYLDGDVAVVGSKRVPLALELPGVFNRGNALMALTALDAINVDLGRAASRMSSVGEVAGRYGLRRVDGQVVRLLLAKNPAGFAAMLEGLGDVHDVWISINARVADGHDPSWLYDVPFEVLRGRRVRCLGERRLDLATRLWYAGVEAHVDEGRPAIEDRVIDVIANYTAFSDLLKESRPC